jgi:hypothetical protein
MNEDGRWHCYSVFHYHVTAPFVLVGEYGTLPSQLCTYRYVIKDLPKFLWLVSSGWLNSELHHGKREPITDQRRTSE